MGLAGLRKVSVRRSVWLQLVWGGPGLSVVSMGKSGMLVVSIGESDSGYRMWKGRVWLWLTLEGSGLVVFEGWVRLGQVRLG